MITIQLSENTPAGIYELVKVELGLPELKVGDEGIDVSHNQPPIDWAAVATVKKFSIHKASEGFDFVDPDFEFNFRRSLGHTRRGIYHFYRPDLRQPERQALHFLDVVKRVAPSKPDLDKLAGYWIDFETPLRWDATLKKFVEVDLIPFRPFMASDLNIFVNTLLANGLTREDIGIYTRRSFLHFHIPVGQEAAKWMFQHDLWAAGFPFVYPNPAYKVGVPWPWEVAGIPVRVWQYDGCISATSALIPGIAKCVDKDIILSLR